MTKRLAFLLATLCALVGTLGFSFVPSEDIIFLGNYENTWTFQFYVDGGQSKVANLKGISRDPYGVEQYCYDPVEDWTLDCYVDDQWLCPEGSSTYIWLQTLVADPSIGYGENFYLECSPEEGGA